MKVLIVSPVLPPNIKVGGGVAITVDALYRKLVEKGCLVKIISPRLNNVDWGSSRFYPSFPLELPTIYNLQLLYRLIKHEADIVVCPETGFLPFLVAFCKIHGKPIWFNSHTNFKHILESTGVLGTYLVAPICDYVFRMFVNLCNRKYTTSESYRNILVNRGYKMDGVFSPRIKLAIFEKHDTIDTIKKERVWLVNEKDIGSRIILLYAGRFSSEKRIPLLAKTLPSNCVLAIVGDGPDESVQSLHDPDNFIFVHKGMVNQDRLRIMFKACDYVVSASLFETLGMTVTEANICGKPVIVQNATGFSTQVLHGTNGFLVDFENDNDICNIILNYKIPTKEQILDFVNSENYWTSTLVNLDEEIIEFVSTYKGVKSKNRYFYEFIIVLLYLLFWVLGFPFNKVVFKVK